MDLKMSAAEIVRLITASFSEEKPWFYIDKLEPGRLLARVPFERWMLRPGNAISGPALFGAADVAMYALVFAHAGPVVSAVTADLNIRFLNRGRPEAILADARLLKLGSRLAVMEVSLRCGDDPTLIAHVTGSYSIPSGASVPPAR
jgi:acyl-coenzyme A thioesterase PaaI-like protein